MASEHLAVAVPAGLGSAPAGSGWRTTRAQLERLALRTVLAVEDVVQAALVAAVTMNRRRQVTVQPFIGYGTPERVHVRARIVLGSRAARAATTTVVVESPDPTPDPPDRPTDAPDPTEPQESAGSEGEDSTDGPAAQEAVTEDVADGPAAQEAVADEGDGGPAAQEAVADEGDGGPAAQDSVTEEGAEGRAAGGRIRGRGRRGQARLGSWRTLRESLTPFFSIELPRTRVIVRGPAGDVTVRADRQGYLDACVDGAGLAPGWQEVAVSASWRGHRTSMPTPVLVIGPDTRLALISDLDDTVIETGLTRGLEFLRLTLLTSVTERTPLPGAAELYRALTSPRNGDRDRRPVFYLSTSPWNLHELLARFMVLRGFPTGPLLLTDWGPSRTNWFRVSAPAHKVTLIRSLLAEHPQLEVVLIGDTGQLDPEIYAAVALEAPERVRAVYVRRTANISSDRADEVDALARRVGAAGVPMVPVQDSLEIARHAAGLGLLTDADVHAVGRATC